MAPQKLQLLNLHGYAPEELNNKNTPILILRSEPEIEAITVAENILNRYDRVLKFATKDYSVDQIFTKYTIAENGKTFLHMVVTELVKRQVDTARSCAIQATNWVRQNHRSLGLVNVMTKTDDIFSGQEITKWGAGVSEVVLQILKGWNLKIPIDGLAAGVYSLETVLQQVPRHEYTFAAQSEQIDATKSFGSPSRPGEVPSFARQSTGYKHHHPSGGSAQPGRTGDYNQRGQNNNFGKQQYQKQNTNRNQTQDARQQNAGRQSGTAPTFHQNTPRTSYAWPQNQKRQNEPQHFSHADKRGTVVDDHTFAEHGGPQVQHEEPYSRQAFQQGHMPQREHHKREMTTESGYSTADSTQQSQHEMSSKDETDQSSFTSEARSQVNVTPSGRPQSSYGYPDNAQGSKNGAQRKFYRPAQRPAVRGQPERPGWPMNIEDSGRIEGGQPSARHSDGFYSSPTPNFSFGPAPDRYEAVESLGMTYYMPHGAHGPHQMDPHGHPFYHPVFNQPYGSGYPYGMPYPPPPPYFYGYPTPDAAYHSPETDRYWHGVWSSTQQGNQPSRGHPSESVSPHGHRQRVPHEQEQPQEGWVQLKEWQSSLPHQPNHHVSAPSYDHRQFPALGQPLQRDFGFENDSAARGFRGSSTTTVTFEGGNPSAATRVVYDNYRQPVSTVTTTFDGPSPIAAQATAAQPPALGPAAFPSHDNRGAYGQNTRAPPSFAQQQKQNSAAPAVARIKRAQNQQSRPMHVERIAYAEHPLPANPTAAQTSGHPRTSAAASAALTTTSDAPNKSQPAGTKLMVPISRPPMSAVGPSFSAPSTPSTQTTPTVAGPESTLPIRPSHNALRPGQKTQQQQPRTVSAPKSAGYVQEHRGQGRTNADASAESKHQPAEPQALTVFDAKEKKAQAHKRSSSMG